MTLIACWECGKKVSDQAVACPNCGAPLSSPSLNVKERKKTSYNYSEINNLTNRAHAFVTDPKSRSLAVLLAILLGGLGLHKFYLNQPGWGVIYILFCWTLIPSIIGVIEGLIYLFMSDESFQQKY